MSSQGKPLVPVVEQVKWERTTESRISTVIGMLPASLQPRIRPFGQLKRRTSSLGNLRMAATLLDDSAVRRQRPLSAPGPGTPTGLDGADAGDGPLAVVSGSDSPVRDVERLSPSGINWRFAQQGTSLLSISADASIDDDNVAFTRKAYLDGLTYLLKSLPSDMDEFETRQIQSALPRNMARDRDPSTRPGAVSENRTSGLPKSTVHRIVQALVVNMVLITHFILPYIVLVLKAVASVERRYKMSEAIIGHGMGFFNAAGRHCARVAEVVLSTNDGTAAKGVSNTFAWTVEEVTRGVSDGLGEGFFMTRLRDSS